MILPAWALFVIVIFFLSIPAYLIIAVTAIINVAKGKIISIQRRLALWLFAAAFLELPLFLVQAQEQHNLHYFNAWIIVIAACAGQLIAARGNHKNYIASLAFTFCSILVHFMYVFKPEPKDVVMLLICIGFSLLSFVSVFVPLKANYEKSGRV